MDSDFQLVAGCDPKGLISAYLESCGVWIVSRKDEDFFPALGQCMEYLSDQEDEELRVILERGPQ